jgi:hypothetical protein
MFLGAILKVKLFTVLFYVYCKLLYIYIKKIIIIKMKNKKMKENKMIHYFSERIKFYIDTGFKIHAYV